MKLYTALLAPGFAAGVSVQSVFTDNVWHTNVLVYANNNQKTISDQTAFRIQGSDYAVRVVEGDR